ncbi:MAG: site-specific DNA-methyltransferase, partial [Clostridia bacterium]|nr:site-specific DNA-methyltransferase [Clostridia bacterium]
SDKKSEGEYLSMMREILTRCRELLTDTGSIYVHIDYRMSGKLRMMMDELFGEDNLMKEIICSYRSGGRSTRNYSRKHDTILFYRKTKKVYFDITATGVPRGSVRRNHMKRRADEEGRIYFSIRSGGKEYRYYEDDPVYPSDVWDDIEHLHQRDPERTGFSTQKPEALLRRVIAASSREGDIVCDLFGGSGTTAAVAASLGRKYLSCDCGAASLFATRRRLIEASRDTELFEEPKPFFIDYAEAETGQTLTEPEKLVLVTPALGGCFVTVPGTAQGPAFLATGTVKDGVFTAEDCITRPKKNDELFVRTGGTLHIVAPDCTQGFFTEE